MSGDIGVILRKNRKFYFVGENNLESVKIEVNDKNGGRNKFKKYLDDGNVPLSATANHSAIFP